MEPNILTMILGLVQTMSVIMVMAYILTRTQFFTDVLEKKFSLCNQMLLIGCFGFLSIYGTVTGFNFFGAQINVRDLGPALAGFAGGPIAGLGAGLVGGAHRWFMGGPTTSTCSISTVLAGLAAGLVYKLRRGKLISVRGAVLFAILAEAAHLTFALFFVASVDLPIIPWETRLSIIETAAIPMIMANALGMGIFIFIVQNLIHERTVESAKKLIEGELKVARDIQMGIVPKIFPAYPDRSEFGLFASIEPAKEVGGDLYDFYELDDRHLFFVIGDVSGKGVPASLFMAITVALFKANASAADGPEKILSAVNNQLACDNESCMFVTIFCGILDVQTGEVSYVNAGHNPPLLIRAAGDVDYLRSTPSLVAGAMENYVYPRQSFTLNQGDCLFLYTDGITEAVNSSDELFGEERLKKEIERVSRESNEQIISSISSKVKAFAGTAPQFDDMTMLAVKYNGNG